VLARAGVVACGLAWMSAGGRPAAQGAADLASLLERVGSQVQEYYRRAQNVVCRETVRLQSLGRDLASDGTHARRLVYDLRVEWTPSDTGDRPEASVLRELVSINGRPPTPRDKPGCMDPKTVSPEPLAMLLPDRQSEYHFTLAGRRRVDGRGATLIDYRSVSRGAASVVWRDDCVSIELPGRSRGRIWIDDETADVLRIDEQLMGMFDLRVPPEQQRRGAADSMTVERADTSIRYRRVAFTEPHETLMLPVSIETLTIVRNAGAPRVRKTQEFSNYRRFVTGGRVVP
jgi:hypothetical protein